MENPVMQEVCLHGRIYGEGPLGDWVMDRQEKLWIQIGRVEVDETLPLHSKTLECLVSQTHNPQ